MPSRTVCGAVTYFSRLLALHRRTWIGCFTVKQCQCLLPLSRHMHASSILISTMPPVPSALQNVRLLALLPLMVSKGLKHTVAAVCCWCAAHWVDRLSSAGAEHVSSLWWSGVKMQCKCFAMLS
jgi:hypothetical protein